MYNYIVSNFNIDDIYTKEDLEILDWFNTTPEGDEYYKKFLQYAIRRFKDSGFNFVTCRFRPYGLVDILYLDSNETRKILTYNKIDLVKLIKKGVKDAVEVVLDDAEK